MPDILLFGATGYTGKLTARTLARRGADFALAGRNRTKLEALAAEVGSPEIRIASAGDVESIVDVMDGVKVLITTVGPFLEYGDAAVEAAIRTKTHYIDSTGEGSFINRLIDRYDARARTAGIAVAPAMGFDEVPIDSVATMAVEGLENPDLWLTLAFPSQGSTGTIKSSLPIVTSRAPWIENGKRRMVGAADEERWAPMPSPLGPKLASSFPLAETWLAPLHLELNSLRLYVTMGRGSRAALKAGLPLLRGFVNSGLNRKTFDKVLDRFAGGPNDEVRARQRWTILGEARGTNGWRNVTAMGPDVYGLTAEFLTAGAMKMAQEGPEGVGVMSPVQAVGLETFQKEFVDHDVAVEVFSEI